MRTGGALDTPLGARWAGLGGVIPCEVDDDRRLIGWSESSDAVAYSGRGFWSGIRDSTALVGGIAIEDTIAGSFSTDARKGVGGRRGPCVGWGFSCLACKGILGVYMHSRMGLAANLPWGKTRWWHCCCW